MMLVAYVDQSITEAIVLLKGRCGTIVVDFGTTPAYTASRAVDVGVINGVSPRAGCVLAQIALSETAALGGSPGHTVQEHIDHAPHMTVLCGTPDAQGTVQIVVSSSVARTGRYAINIQRIV